MKLRKHLFKTVGGWLILLMSTFHSFSGHSDILNVALDSLCFQPAEQNVVFWANGIVDRLNANPKDPSAIRDWQKNAGWIQDSGQCFDSLPDPTRFFLYRRFSQVAIGESSVVQEKLIQKFSKLAYLSCRESSGRVVAHVAHEHESEVRASRYGSTYTDMQSAIFRLVDLRRRYSKASYFSRSTNAGMFQISADMVDSHSDSKKAYLNKWFTDKILEMNGLPKSKLITYCGTEDFFKENLTKEVTETIAIIAQLIQRRSASGILFSNADASIGNLVWFHQLQDICPGLHLDLAKEVLMTFGRDYFGPLNNSKNSRSCGASFSLCGTAFTEVKNQINTNRVQIQQLMN